MTEKIQKVGSAVAVVDPNTAVVPAGWEDRFAQYVDDTPSASTLTDGWPWISAAGGSFSFLDAPVGETMEVIVLGATRENLKYDGDYNPSEPSAPVCWAIDKGDGLAPSDKVADAIHPTCEGCVNDEWGSGKGRGKACRNYVRLALVSADNPGRDGSRLRLPPTAVGAWAKYARKIEVGLKRPLFSCVTRLSIVRRPAGFSIVPELAGFVNDEASLETLAARLDESKVELLREYEPREDDVVDKKDTDDPAF